MVGSARGQCSTHLLLPALIARPLHPRLSPLIRNIPLVPILLTRAGTLSFPAALAFDAGRTGACAYRSSIADATSSAVGTRQSSDRQRVHETEEARGTLIFFAPKSVDWGIALTSSGCISGERCSTKVTPHTGRPLVLQTGETIGLTIFSTYYSSTKCRRLMYPTFLVIVQY